MQHIPDEQMPADFLTKWIGQKKLDKSIAYATNSRRASTNHEPTLRTRDSVRT